MFQTNRCAYLLTDFKIREETLLERKKLLQFEVRKSEVGREEERGQEGVCVWWINQREKYCTMSDGRSEMKYIVAMRTTVTLASRILDFFKASAS